MRESLLAVYLLTQHVVSILLPVVIIVGEMKQKRNECL